MALRIFVLVCGMTCAAAGSCSAKDESWIKAHFRNGNVSFADMNNDCEHSSFSIWSGFDMDSMKSCIKQKTGMSDSCAQCWGNHGQYGIDNCKLPCLLTWCNTACLSCLNKDLPNVNKCTGFQQRMLKTCDGKVMPGMLSSVQLVVKTTSYFQIIMASALIGLVAGSVAAFDRKPALSG